MDEQEKIQKFLADIDAVCRLHNFSISHEDGHGSFLIDRYNAADATWLRNAIWIEDLRRISAGSPQKGRAMNRRMTLAPVASTLCKPLIVDDEPVPAAAMVDKSLLVRWFEETFGRPPWYLFQYIQDMGTSEVQND